MEDTNLEAARIPVASIFVSSPNTSCRVRTAITTSSREVFPALSPSPLIVHSICLAPFKTAESELETARPKSL